MKPSKKKISPSDDAQTQIGGPFLAAAIICEKVLRERDEVATIVRVFDQVTVELPPGAPAGAKQIPVPVTFTLFVSFKSGSFIGEKVLSVRPHGLAQAKTPKLIPLVFAGESQGPVVIADIGFFVRRSGLIWIDVGLDGKRVTMIPLNVILKYPDDPKKASRKSATNK